MDLIEIKSYIFGYKVRQLTSFSRAADMIKAILGVTRPNSTLIFSVALSLKLRSVLLYIDLGTMDG